MGVTIGYDQMPVTTMTGKLNSASSYLRLLLDENTSTAQAIGLLRTVDRKQLIALTEIAHNLLFNESLVGKAEYVKRRRHIFKTLANKAIPLTKRQNIVRDHPLIVLRALHLSRGYLLKVLG